jgi:hypothetical protein
MELLSRFFALMLVNVTLYMPPFARLHHLFSRDPSAPSRDRCLPRPQGASRQRAIELARTTNCGLISPALGSTDNLL